MITTAIFLLQIYHLYWLLTDVVLQKLTGSSFYVFTEAGALVSVVADYLEIPTLLSATLLYVTALRQKFSWRSVSYLVLLNSQWAHILWITDEVVLETFASSGLPAVECSRGMGGHLDRFPGSAGDLGHAGAGMEGAGRDLGPADRANARYAASRACRQPTACVQEMRPP
ncbi:MAG TPA: hypothetical protein VGW38_22570 [Chloroflexota bacterium]|nr:hypothetical protein [Chloroflexota bacterium]